MKTNKELLKMEAVVFSETFAEESIKPILKKIIDEKFEKELIMFQVAIQEVEGILFPSTLNNGKDGRIFLVTSTCDIDLICNCEASIDIFKNWTEQVLLKLVKQIKGICRMDYIKTNETLIFDSSDEIIEEKELSLETLLEEKIPEDYNINNYEEIFEFIDENYEGITEAGWTVISKQLNPLPAGFIIEYNQFLDFEILEGRI